MKETKTVSREPENPQRRSFLIGLITVMGGFIAFILGGSGATYFLSPAWRTKKEDWVEVGPVDGIKGGDPVKLDYVKRKKDGWQVIESPSSVWVMRQKDEWVAFDPHCTHLGCPYRWDASKQAFLCPCHGGVFSKDGTVVSGPPPKPLQRYPVKVEGGTIYVLPGGVA
ncbi:MAG TPA: ubiquinol-cytochrome c reductase iron-sulfur subunit [bacterium]|nr:ubiquinol-cytochrome c reductase iron-sulfur subunit [bacterium]